MAELSRVLFVINIICVGICSLLFVFSLGVMSINYKELVDITFLLFFIFAFIGISSSLVSFVLFIIKKQKP